MEKPLTPTYTKEQTTESTENASATRKRKKKKRAKISNGYTRCYRSQKRLPSLIYPQTHLMSLVIDQGQRNIRFCARTTRLYLFVSVALGV